MPSLQSTLLQFFIRRMSFFGNGGPDPKLQRNHSDQVPLFSKPYRDVKAIPVDASGVPSEWLVPRGAPEDRTVLYLHGGAWYLGSTGVYRAFVSYLAYTAGIRALVINYRLAPEHPFPAGLDDCIAAYDWLLQNGFAPNKIVVAGDSAGGNLTLALLVALREAGAPLPTGAVAISPATDLAMTGESVRTRHHLDPYFYNMNADSRIVPNYITTHDPHEPTISPLYADLYGLPPLLLHVGENEILFDDSVRFYDKACSAGVDAKITIWPDMFHVFQMFTPFLPEARKANAQIAAFIQSRVVRP